MPAPVLPLGRFLMRHRFVLHCLQSFGEADGAVGGVCRDTGEQRDCAKGRRQAGRQVGLLHICRASVPRRRARS
jgi:hypothetical protein